jgi:hypothetical protein
MKNNIPLLCSRGFTIRAPYITMAQIINHEWSKDHNEQGLAICHPEP